VRKGECEICTRKAYSAGRRKSRADFSVGKMVLRIQPDARINIEAMGRKNYGTGNLL
jgi:hypothetical protein